MSERIGIAATDGVELAGERWPGERKQIVLLHAGVADRRSWAGVADELSRDGFDVLAYDRRGFGETPATGAPDHLADLRRVLEETARAPVLLVGNSQGGRIALDLASTEPDRVAGLVLIAPAVSGRPDPEAEELDEDTLRIDTAIEAAIAAGDTDSANRLEAHLWLDGPAGPEGRVGGAPRELALAMNAIALAAEWPEKARPPELDTWSRLEEIHVPATVVWGELDLPFLIAGCRIVAERLPNTRRAIELSGVAHLPGLEDPGRVAAVIRDAAGD